MAWTWTTSGALGPSSLAVTGGTGTGTITRTGTGTATRTCRHVASMRAAACGWSIAVSTSAKASSGKLVRSTARRRPGAAPSPGASMELALTGACARGEGEWFS